MYCSVIDNILNFVVTLWLVKCHHLLILMLLYICVTFLPSKDGKWLSYDSFANHIKTSRKSFCYCRFCYYPPAWLSHLIPHFWQWFLCDRNINKLIFCLFLFFFSSSEMSLPWRSAGMEWMSECMNKPSFSQRGSPMSF